MFEKDDVVVAHENHQVVIQKYIHVRTVVGISFDLVEQFNEFLNIKYENNGDEIENNKDQELDNLFHLGLVATRIGLGKEGTSLLYDGRKPRKDVLINLGSIANEFLLCNSYPKIPAGALPQILNKCLVGKDKRIVRKYRKTILLYCNIHEDVIERCTNDNRLGIIDVSRFVKQIPKQYLLSNGI